jgi:glycosyltransferase involved in cell wall biosynthesis
MKIFHSVASYFPEKIGMSEVAKRISEGLVKQGHEVVILTGFNEKRQNDLINGVKVVSFNISGNYLDGFKGEVQEYIDYLIYEKYDILVNFAAQQWATDLCFDILDKITAKKIFVPTGFSGLFLKKYESYFYEMKNWVLKYDHTIFLGYKYRDYTFCKNICNLSNDKISVITNGASKEEFLSVSKFDIKTKLCLNKNDKLIIHIGSYTGYKGHIECLKIFYKSKLKNTNILFVGENFELNDSLKFISKFRWFKNLQNTFFYRPWAISNFFFYVMYSIKGYSKKTFAISLKRNELIASLQQADLFLFPSNIECSPVVLFESMASKTPFLVSDVGNSKEIIEWTNGGELLKTVIDKDGFSHIDINASAKHLFEILNNNKKLNTYGLNGYDAWLNNFTWENIVIQYENLYRKIINE